MDLPGYTVQHQIYRGTHTEVFRATRNSDGQSVILKVLKAMAPQPEHILRFQHEFDLIRTLDSEGVIQVHELHCRPQHCIVLEDFGASSLLQLQIIGKQTPSDFLQLAIQLVDALAQVHHQHIIHKDINPANIILNPETGQLKLIDFGISTVLSRETLTYRSPNQLEGTLPYMSPEQTGRMNRTIDYRSDYYSLGVTLYELLTGKRPFPGQEPLELVHAHIAVQPQPPHVVKKSIPPILSAIILKLMAKNAEDRYQSAGGIRADLERCLKQINLLSTLDFPLAQQDTFERFQIPQKLYGREGEIASLMAAFDRIVNDSSNVEQCTELVLITGPAGIGKSALVREIYRPVTERHGHFIGGKFDQLQRNVPYFAFLQAFRSLIEQILTDDEAMIDEWRQKFLTALGVNGQVIVDVLPELAFIIGPQRPVPELGINKSLNRFKLTLQHFIGAFAQPQHPLVLYLDDLQWADGASLRLIEQLLTTVDVSFLLLVVTYRDDEVGPDHPLSMMLTSIARAQASITEIRLAPLEQPQVSTLVTETLHQPCDRVQPLTNLLIEKTRGNPYFIREFLKSLYIDGLIAFTPNSPNDLLQRDDPMPGDADRGQGEWQWHTELIRERNVTENVVDLLAQQIHQLPEVGQQVLQRAACLGNRFSLANLATIHEKSEAETTTDLWPAIVEGYILPLGEQFGQGKTGNAESSGAETGDNGLTGHKQLTYRFAHDRVQQAAYAQIGEGERQTVHRQIGLSLIANLSAAEQEEHLFEIVGQLNRGLTLVADDAARRQLADLNLRAGVKAKQATAYDAALDYLQNGLDLSSTDDKDGDAVDGWRSDYELTLSLHTEAAEAAYLNREFDRSDRLVDIILRCAKAELDKVRAYEVRIGTRVAQNEMVASLDVGLEALRRLGIFLMHEPPPLPAIDELLRLPVMNAPEQLAALDIIVGMQPSALIAKPELLSALVFTAVDLTLNLGSSPPGAYSFVSYGMLVLADMDDIEQGYQLSQLGLQLLARYDAKAMHYRANFTFSVFMRHWKEDARDGLKAYQNQIQDGLEVGEIEFAGYIATESCLNLILVGEPLDSVHQQQSAYIELLEKLLQEESTLYAWVASQFVLNLRSTKSNNPHQLTGERFDAAGLLPVLQQANSYTTLFVVHSLSAWLCLLFKEYGDAVTHAQLAEQYAQSVVGLMVVAPHNFIYSLALLSAWPIADESTQADYLAQVAANQERMALWADHAPMNYQHKFDLVEAERLCIIGEQWSAAIHYERAIRGANTHGYLQDEALAHELAAEFFLANDMETVGQMHLRAAHDAYFCWQASAKVAALEVRFPQLTAHRSGKGRATSHFFTSSTGSTNSTSTSVLDAASIVKASQTLSSEIDLKQLLIRLMHLAIENAGAETGHLLLHQDEQWTIEAIGHVNQSASTQTTGTQTDVTVMQSIMLEQINYLPRTIINYVARTRQPVVVDDAKNNSSFQRDRAILEHQPKSVLCMPLLNQHKLSAILYLENNLIPGAFTKDRLEVLTLLGSQAAISIENATLYAQQREAEARAQHMVQFQQSLIEASNRLQQNPTSTTLYQQILEQAVRIIPGAQAGSITRRSEDNRHYFVAAVGYDLDELAQISFEDGGYAQQNASGASYLIYEFDEIGKTELSQEQYEILSQVGKLQSIQVTLMVPIRQAENMVATLLLDNMDNRQAFDDEARRMAEAFGVQVGVVLQQLELRAGLVREEERYRHLVESMNDGLTVVNEDATITFANDALCEMLGYTADELVGLPLRYLFDENNRRILDEQSLLHEAGANEPYEITYRRKNGLPLYAIVSPQPVFDDDKVFRGSVTVTTDITERALMQQVLEQRVEERTYTLETLLETTRSVLSTLDLEPLLNMILDQLERVVAYAGSVILGLEGDELVVLAYRGPSPENDAVGQRYPAAPMLRNLEPFDLQMPLIVPDVSCHSVVPPILQQMLGERLDFLLDYSRAWMAIPLHVGEEMIGLLSVGHNLPDYYTPQQSELVKAFADQAALAILNAQRYRQAPIEAIGEERSRLARELHDSVTQALYTANLYAGAAKRALTSGKQETTQEYIQELQGTIREATHDMRLLIFELRPPLLEKEGLASAIRSRIESVEARSGIDVQFVADDQVRLPIAIEAELYRVVQEALNNIVKHAHAKAVSIKWITEENHGILEVSDNGRGFDPQTSGGDGHIGLTSMAERVENLGGTLTIQSAPAQGTTIQVKVPVNVLR
ncbi:MAG: AAA family ATPase [Chloroflexota bacterium]